jgi:hypothetical protein
MTTSAWPTAAAVMGAWRAGPLMGSAAAPLLMAKPAMAIMATSGMAVVHTCSAVATLAPRRFTAVSSTMKPSPSTRPLSMEVPPSSVKRAGTVTPKKPSRPGSWSVARTDARVAMLPAKTHENSMKPVAKPADGPSASRTKT